jgi:hypothetical protein
VTGLQPDCFTTAPCGTLQGAASGTEADGTAAACVVLRLTQLTGAALCMAVYAEQQRACHGAALRTSCTHL